MEDVKKIAKKNLIRGIFIGIWSCFVFAILVMVAWIYAYLHWFFDDNWGISWMQIDKTWEVNNERVLTFEDIKQEQPKEETKEESKVEEKDENKGEIKEENKADEYIKKQTETMIEAIDTWKSEVDAFNKWEREKETLIIEAQKEVEKLRQQNKQELTKAEEEKKKKEEERKLNEQKIKEEQEKMKKIESEKQKLIGSVSTHDIDLVNLYNYFKENNNTFGLDFLATYYLLYKQTFSLNDFLIKWNAVDQDNKVSIVDWDLQKKKPTQITADIENEYYQKREEVKKALIDMKTKNGKVVIDTCFYKFCWQNNELKQVYWYVKKAMIADKELTEQLKVARKDGVSPKFYLTILLIENTRMHTQYKQNFKNLFLKYSSPKLAVMSQFSFGKYGTKVNFITNLINNNYTDGSIFAIGDFPVLKNLKDTYYLKNANWTWYPRNQGDVVEWLIKDKQGQTDIISAFFKMAAQWWKLKNVDLWKAENAGILLTLYNIGKLWEPKVNPELWWAMLNFTNPAYNFGQLANIIYNSLELDDIMQQMGL